MIRPRIGQIDVPAGTPDGYVPQVDGGRLVLDVVPASGVQTIVEGANVTVDDTDSENPVVAALVLEPLTTDINGVPDLVWDDDNQLIMTGVV